VHTARQAAPCQSGVKPPHSKFPTPSGGGYHQFFIPQHIFCVMTGFLDECQKTRVALHSLSSTCLTWERVKGHSCIVKVFP
jgi:hypothetical protein